MLSNSARQKIYDWKNEDIHKTIRLNFINIRKNKLKLTKVAMSKKLCGIPSVSGLSNFEKGRNNMSFYMLYRICYKFNIKITDLIPSVEEVFIDDLSLNNTIEDYIKNNTKE